jgi:hypothetical protein
MVDHLLTWLQLRDKVDWPSTPAIRRPARGDHDGVADFISSTVHRRDPDRARRLLVALEHVGTAAAGREPLTFALLSSWQREILGEDQAGFRTGPAFAKGGRERYGLHPDTPQVFDHCLMQSADPQLPLAARAARGYLDVAFFHPFPDGNGRAAMLALYFILAREEIVLGQAAPILMTVRRADDPAGAFDLARLITILINVRPPLHV